MPEKVVAMDRTASAGDAGREPIAIQMPVDVRSAALTVLAVVAAVFVLQTAQAMVIPVVLAVLISYALDPIVTWVERARIPRGVSAALLLVALVSATGTLLYALRGEATAILQELPAAAARLRRSFEDDKPKGAAAIQQVQKAASELEKAATAAATPPPAPPGVTRVQVESPPFDISDYVVWGSMSIAAAIGQLVLILFLVFFLLASGDLYRRKMVRIAGPTLTEKKITLQILQEIDRQIEQFLLVQVFTSVGVAVATWLAFRAIGLQQAAVWGVLAGVFTTIPYFGPVLVTGAMAVVGYMQFGTGRMAVIAALVALAITSVEGALTAPWFVRRGSRMNAVAVFVGLLFWSWIWNVWGMLLAVPMLMAIKAVCDHVEDLKPLGELLGD